VSYLSENSQGKTSDQQQKVLDRLKLDLAIFRGASHQTADATLIVGGHEIKAHKAILAARSPVFFAMFEHESTREAQDGRVVIIDADVESIEQMLKYIYYGDISGIDGIEDKMLAVADKV